MLQSQKKVNFKFVDINNNPIGHGDGVKIKNHLGYGSTEIIYGKVLDINPYGITIENESFKKQFIALVYSCLSEIGNTRTLKAYNANEFPKYEEWVKVEAAANEFGINTDNQTNQK